MAEYHSFARGVLMKMGYVLENVPLKVGGTLALVTSGIPVFWVHGFSGWGINNSSPLLAGLILLWLTPKERISEVVGYCIALMAMTAFFHLAWIFDWGETKTGSSTSAIMFVFLPIFTLVLSLVGLLIGWVVKWVFIRKRNGA